MPGIGRDRLLEVVVGLVVVGRVVAGLLEIPWKRLHAWRQGHLQLRAVVLRSKPRHIATGNQAATCGRADRAAGICIGKGQAVLGQRLDMRHPSAPLVVQPVPAG